LGHPKIGSITFRSYPLKGLCTEPDVIQKMQDEACTVGAAVVNVHTVRQPDHFFSNCFYATGDFYADATGFQPAPAPIVELPPPSPTAVELEVGFGFSGIVAGPEKTAPLDPQPDSITNFVFGLSGRYMIGRLGLNLALDPLRLARASKANYKPVTVYTGQMVRLGPLVSLVQHQFIGGVFRLDLGGGANYTWLRMGDGLKDVVRGEGLVPRDDAATGWGYYGMLEARHQQDSGLLTSLALKYEHEFPRFSGAPAALDGQTVELRLQVGHRF
jgi:hypothetical protein